MKTVKEILHEHTYIDNTTERISLPEAIKAMEEYAKEYQFIATNITTAEIKKIHALEFASFLTMTCYESCDLDKWQRWYDDSVPEEDRDEKQYSNEEIYDQFLGL